MIKKIGIKNFRVFKDYTEFEIRPITILTGPNNSGKSSLIKFLLLLSKGFLKLNFQDRRHSLKGFEDVLSWNRSKEAQSIPLYIKKNHAKVFPNAEYCFEYLKDGRFKYDVILKDKQNEGPGHSIFSFERVEPFMASDYEDLDNSDTDTMTFDHELSSKFEVNWVELINLILSKKILFNGLPVENWGGSFNGFKNELDFLLPKNLREVINELRKVQEKEGLTINSKTKFDIKKNNALLKVIEVSQPRRYKKGDELIINSKAIQFLKLISLNNRIDNYNEKKGENYLFYRVSNNGDDVTSEYAHLIFEIQNDILNEIFRTVPSIKNATEKIHKIIHKEGKHYLEEKLINKISEKRIKSNMTHYELKVENSELNNLIFEENLFLNSSTLWDCIKYDLDQFDTPLKLIHIKPNKGIINRIITENESELFKIFETYYYLNKSNAIIRYLRESMQLFNLKGTFGIENIENSAYKASLEFNGRHVNISDLGFGYSQIIPMILGVINAFSNLGNTFISRSTIILAIEEPEQNLHPSFQSKLADFICLTHKYFPKINVLIETHSEYLIRKLQYLTAKNEIKTEESIIYYFNDDKYVNEEESKVKPIEITETGGLTDTFGPGFFDETTRIQFALAKLNKSHNK